MESIELAPIFDRYTVYSDIYFGDLYYHLYYPGESLGRDCMIAGFAKEGPRFVRLYSGDGMKNDDWFSWNANVYAPISGTVRFLRDCNTINDPGKMSSDAPSGAIVIKADNGTYVILEHIQNPLVEEGQSVTEGQIIASVGNNGLSRYPHIHISAYKDKAPLEILFDAKKTADLRMSVSDDYWFYGMKSETE